MKPPRFWLECLRMGVLMLLVFIMVLLLVRGKMALVLMFSAMPLASLLEAWVYRPLLAFVGSAQRLEAALWLMIVLAYVQWTLLGALLAYAWETWRYRRAQSCNKSGKELN